MKKEMAVLNHIETLGKMVGIIFTPMVSTGLIGLALVVIYNAMVRFLPISPNQMAWTEEIGRLLLLWIAFVGAGLITRDEKHFVIDIFTKKMGNRLRSFCRVAGDILMISFLVLLIWETVPVVLDQMGQMTSGAVELPLGIFSLSLLAGSFIMLFYIVAKSILDFRSLRTEMTANKSGQE